MDSTTKMGTERIGKLFLQYIIPSVIGMIFFSIYIVIDGIFVGQVVGGRALAAINIAMPFFSVSTAISIMLSAGANTIVAIELGEGEKEKARKTFSLAFYTLMVLSWTVSGITLLFLEPICILLGATKELLPMVKVYLAVLCLGVPIFAGSGLLSAGIRAMGRPTYSMVCTIIGSVLNIVFDYIFVVKLNTGVFGAAFASGLAFLFSFVIGLVVYLPRKSILHFTRCQVDFKKIGRFFYNGSSEALTEIAVAFSTYIFNIVLLKRVGEAGVSAFSIISYVTSLIVALFLGIATGIAPIISYNYGAKKTERIMEINNLAIKTMIGVGITCTFGMVLFGRPLIELFEPNDKELIEMTVWATRLYSIAFLINGINILGASYFTALEDAKTSAIISFLRGILFIVIGIVILPPLMGEAGVWLTVFFSEAVTLIVTIILFKKSYKSLRKL